MARRALAFLAFAAAALILGGCVFGGGGDDTEATATAEVTATLEVSPTSDGPSAPTGTATAAPALPPGLEVTTTDAWVREDLAPGDVAPDRPGVIVVNAETGVGTSWSWADDVPYAVISRPVAGMRFIWSPATNALLDTQTGRAWSWPTSVGLIALDDRGFGVFSRPDIEGCGFSVVDFSGEELRALGPLVIGDDGPCRRKEARLSPDAASLLLTMRGDEPATDLFLVDLETEQVELLGTMPVSAAIAARSDPDVVLLTAPGADELWVGRYTWEERELTVSSIAIVPDDSVQDRRTGNALISPDGQWVAWGAGVDLGVGDGLGGLAEWPITVIASVDEGAPTIWAERVTMTSGIQRFDWLPDSSALVVQSESGFALLGTDGELRSLPFPVAAHTGAIPIPAPDRADRFLYDGAIVDAGGDFVGMPSAAYDAWGRHELWDGPYWWSSDDYRWGADSRQFVLTRVVVDGRDYGRGGIALLGLRARIVTGAGATHPEVGALRVSSDGDRLNVRAAPGAAAERIGQFEDGSELIVGRDPTPSDCFDGCSILHDPDLEYDEGWWIYVTGAGTEGDLAGWVSSEFLDWAD